MFKKYGSAIIWVLTAIVILISAPIFKGTEYENAWLYIFAVGSLLAGVAEIYSKR